MYSITANHGIVPKYNTQGIPIKGRHLSQDGLSRPPLQITLVLLALGKVNSKSKASPSTQRFGIIGAAEPVRKIYDGKMTALVPIYNLSDIKISRLSGEDHRCPICTVSYVSDSSQGGDEAEAAVRLPCSHVIGSKCLAVWLQKGYTCPFCRNELYMLPTISRLPARIQNTPANQIHQQVPAVAPPKVPPTSSQSPATAQPTPANQARQRVPAVAPPELIRDRQQTASSTTRPEANTTLAPRATISPETRIAVEQSLRTTVPPWTRIVVEQSLRTTVSQETRIAVEQSLRATNSHNPIKADGSMIPAIQLKSNREGS